MEELEIYIDGVSKGNPGESSCGVVIYGEGQVLEKFGAALGTATNNVAEYCALVLGLAGAGRMGVRRVRVHSDSLLLVKQLNGEYRVKDAWLKRLHLIARALMDLFTKVEIVHISREKNKEADKLANSYLKEPAEGLF